MADSLTRQLEEIIRETLDRLGVAATVAVSQDEGGLHVSIDTEDSALLIGWRGQTLAAFEYIVRVLMAHRIPHDDHLPELHIDVGGYRQRQTDELVELAKKTAETVRQTGQSEILRPMNAFERRVVHVTLADMADLATESIGADPNRRIIIKLK